jgi:hypothetical protein
MVNEADNAIQVLLHLLFGFHHSKYNLCPLYFHKCIRFTVLVKFRQVILEFFSFYVIVQPKFFPLLFERVFVYIFVLKLFPFFY